MVLNITFKQTPPGGNIEGEIRGELLWLERFGAENAVRLIALRARARHKAGGEKTLTPLRTRYARKKEEKSLR